MDTETMHGAISYVGIMDGRIVTITTDHDFLPANKNITETSSTL